MITIRVIVLIRLPPQRTVVLSTVLKGNTKKCASVSLFFVKCVSRSFLYFYFRFEHIELHDELDGKEFVVEFDFLGKDSIR